jgi:hypothetical protein
VVVAIRSRRQPAAALRWLAAAAGGCLGLAGFAFYCLRKYGDPFAFAHIQGHYGRGLGLLHPFRALARFNVDPDYYLVTAAALCAAAIMIRRALSWRSISAWFLLLLPLSTGTLKAMIRYQAVNLPLLAGSGEMLRGKLFAAILAMCLFLMCVEAFLYGKGFAHY